LHHVQSKVLFIIIVPHDRDPGQLVSDKQKNGPGRINNLSGPLSLPTRASANSLSAPIRSSAGTYLICMRIIVLRNFWNGTLHLSCQFILIISILIRHDILLATTGYVGSLGDKPKRNMVEIKGRFSVTSENVDLAKVGRLVTI
jgi:hypothetical protein